MVVVGIAVVVVGRCVEHRQICVDFLLLLVVGLRTICTVKYLY
jgi:hypothetical protein